MEKSRCDINLTQQALVDFFSQLPGAADKQDFFFAQFLQQRGQPFDLGF